MSWYKCFWAQTCVGTNVSGHKSVWTQTCVGTNVYGHKRVWAQTCVGTNVCGHKREWAQTCVGTKVSGHKRVRAQTCVGTNVSEHKCVWAQTCLGTIVWAQVCMGTNVWSPTPVHEEAGVWTYYVCSLFPLSALINTPCALSEFLVPHLSFVSGGLWSSAPFYVVFCIVSTSNRTLAKTHCNVHLS